jgi:hypothetical protein
MSLSSAPTEAAAVARKHAFMFRSRRKLACNQQSLREPTKMRGLKKLNQLLQAALYLTHLSVSVAAQLKIQT